MINQIQQAYQILLSGGLVAFPTETVYGLGADATNPNAIRKVFQVKNRPIDHPLIVHVAKVDDFSCWAKEIPDFVYKLAECASPGPITFVLPKKEHVSDLITAGQDTVALRIPNHKLTLQLLEQFKGLVGPSANAHCHISPTCKEHVITSLGNKVDYILDGGPCSVGIESTIVSCLPGQGIKILREGMINKEKIEHWLDCTIDELSIQARSKIKVSGNLKKHYAPKTKSILINKADIIDVSHQHQGHNIVFIKHSTDLEQIPDNWTTIHVGSNPVQYAQSLYASLYNADNQGADIILIENIAPSKEWAPIIDKLHRLTT